MNNDGLDESKEKIIKEFFEKKDNPDFKGFKIQAGPGTGKTYLLKKIISKLSDKGESRSICVLSFSNSSIDTISNELEEKNSIDIKTIASFFIENFIIPFSYTIVENEELNDLKIEYKNYGKIEVVNSANIILFLKNITNNFSENSISPKSPGWNILDKIIEVFLIKDKYFYLFHNLLLQKGIKYIFIDEYQDTKGYLLNIFNKIIEKGKIKFICVGDKNQQINYEDLKDNYFSGLENKVLKTTYRFGKNILNKTNSIIESGIEKSDTGIIDGNILDNLGYIPRNGNETERLENLCDFIIKYIQQNNLQFIGKNNVILFQPATDENYQFGNQFNTQLKKSLENNSNIIFSYTEKPIYNIHLKLFFEKLISFINGNIIYSEVEKHLKFFYEKGDNNYKTIFSRIIKFKITDNISNIGNILQEDGFKSGGNYKVYFREIIDNIKNNDISFEKAEGKTLIELLNKKENTKIYISTSTITSSKGKAYDNIFILNIYNKSSFSKELIKNNEEVKRHYYVAVSRAKENVFTFVNY